MSKRIRAGAVAAGAMLALTGAATNAHGAADAYPETSYYVSNRYNEVVSGNLVWYNQSVRVGGKLTVPTGCASVKYSTWTEGGRKLDEQVREVCNGSRGHGFTLDADVAGGAHHVWVDLRSAGIVNKDLCTRSGCESR
ncbi:hypothetical protein [Streptomyces sp. NBC_00286]|uniref:hypothetical protein n=1 Tax=Streptomyces sp. NBC_00286 TaxID=2975701 RepID=UPI002E2D80F1|nr:hypothetical protein [Streptomyces sp. NBC_00286]